VQDASRGALRLHRKAPGEGIEGHADYLNRRAASQTVPKQTQHNGGKVSRALAAPDRTGPPGAANAAAH
jgi:hypothetical protein